MKRLNGRRRHHETTNTYIININTYYLKPNEQPKTARQERS